MKRRSFVALASATTATTALAGAGTTMVIGLSG